MFADQPYSPVTRQHGESARRFEITTFSTFSSNTSFINVRRNCPTTCGICCENNLAFKFIDEDETARTCSWVEQTSTRINQYCVQPRLQANCPAKNTCNSCKTYVGKS